MDGIIDFFCMPAFIRIEGIIISYIICKPINRKETCTHHLHHRHSVILERILDDIVLPQWMPTVT